MAAQTYPTPTPRVGNFSTAQWRPLMEQRLDPGYFLETFRYGAGEYYFDFLEMANRTINLTTDNPKVYEKLAIENTVKTEEEVAVSGAAGDPFTFRISTDDLDAYGNTPVRVGDGIVVGAQYQTQGEDRIYVITTVTKNSVTDVDVVCEPLTEAGATIGASQISVAIPAGTTFKIHSYYTGRGTDLPPGKNNYRLVREYQTQIIKNTAMVEGGMQSLKWYEVPTDAGGTTAYWESQDIQEFNHRKQCDDALFLGEINDNTALVETSGAGGSNLRKSTKGIWNWAKEVGQPLDYGAGWDMSYMYDIKDLLLSTLVTSREVMFNVGTDLLREIELSNLDWIQSYSGGSDLMMAADKLGIETLRVFVNGVLFQINELKSFGNPLRWGNKDMNFTKYGLIIPEGSDNATIEGRRELHPVFNIGYLNNNGENRTKIMGVLDGTTGRSIPVNGSDLSQTFIQTELAAIVLRPEQLITVEPE